MWVEEKNKIIGNTNPYARRGLTTKTKGRHKTHKEREKEKERRIEAWREGKQNLG